MSKKLYAGLISIIIFIIIIIINMIITSAKSFEKNDIVEAIETFPVTTISDDIFTFENTTTPSSVTSLSSNASLSYSTTTTITTTSIVTTTEEVTTVITTEENHEDVFYLYRDSMRVHTYDCEYTDPSCMEAIYGNYVESARKCQVCNPDISIGEEYIPITESNTNNSSLSSDNTGLERNWSINEMTYYSGYIGAAGTPLIDNYSVACNSIPLGTIVYIQSSDGSVNGYYRVDDTGGMGNNVIDIFYSSYNNVPSSFRNAGRVSCTVWIVG